MDMDDPHMLHTVATPGTATAVKKQTKTIAAVDDMWTKYSDNVGLECC